MPRKVGASSKGKGRLKGTKRGREEGEDSLRGPTPPPEDLPPADGADQDLPPTEEERPQEEEDQPVRGRGGGRRRCRRGSYSIPGVPGVQGKEGEDPVKP